MLDAYIIDKMKREKEERESAWQPLPLEIPAFEEDDREEEPKKDDKNKIVQIQF